MFLGHAAVAFGAKKYAPQVSLGFLFLACQLADIIWPNLLLLGVEKVTIEPGNTVLTPLNFLHYPFSHSLVATLLWAALLAVIYRVVRGAGTKSMIVIAVVVLSHWVLDAVTHRPDMPVTLSGPTRLGAGLWNIPIVAIVLELSLFSLGVWMYQRNTRANNRQGSYGFWALVIFLLSVYAANLFGPPPPSVAAIAWSGQALWLLVIWGFWVDRNRVPIT